jgi:hypothetical protein
MVNEEQINFIALMETSRNDFPDATLKKFCGGRDFLWHCMAPHGRCGGIILGVNIDVFDIGSIYEGDFMLNFSLEKRKMDSNGSCMQCMDRLNRTTNRHS